MVFADDSLLKEIADRARAAGRNREVVLIAEDERNSRRLLESHTQGGVGLDGAWADDFHHVARRRMAGDSESYYQDYSGTSAEMANAKHSRGTSTDGLEPAQFVHCIQNHDQIGNRPFGDRLGKTVSPSAYRAMSALLLFSPHTPMLFMGQEWNATTPFLFFTDHKAELGKSITEGRRREFSHFAGFGKNIPDPQAADTFEASKLDWNERDLDGHREMLAFYQELLSLRANHPVMKDNSRDAFIARPFGPNAVLMDRVAGEKRLRMLVNFEGETEVPLLDGEAILLHSEESQFDGSPANVTRTGQRITVQGSVALILESTEKKGAHQE
jgi:maltooligosyltrehalose trehalohydrolase